MEYKFNSLQTELTDDVLKDLDSSSISELYDCLSKIYLIQALSRPDRKYAKDLQRWDNPNNLDSRIEDKNGRIYVDLENPHILEDMDYFRPAAKHFEEFGCYTKLFKNSDPSSDYMKFWNEERRRCKEGYIRESDGEWISGYNYHYWNYGRVMIKKKNGAKTASNNEGFPNIYDSDYWYFHYIEQAENNGQFGFSLKKRRWGYSFKLANMLCRNYVHFRKSKSYILAFQKEYLYKDGPLTKFKENLSFIEDNTPYWSPRLKNIDEHTKSGYVDKKLGIEKGRFSEVMGITCKDDPDKGRGKCFAENTKVLMSDGSVKFIQDIITGDEVMGPDSKPRKVLELHSGEDHMYKIIPMNGNVQIVNSLHDIYTIYYDYKNKKQYSKLITPGSYINEPVSVKIRYNLRKTGIEFNEKELPIDPYFLGLWLGNGASAKPEITNIDQEVIDYLYKYADGFGIKCKEYTKRGACVRQIMFSGGDPRGGYHNIQVNKITNLFRDLNLIKNKHIPDLFLKNSRENRLRLLAGIIDTDGHFDKKYYRFEIIQVNKILADQIVYLCRSLGFKTSMNVKHVKGYNKNYYRITIFNDLHLIPTKIKRKQAEVRSKQQLNNLDTKFKVSYNGIGKYYGFTVDGDNLFLLDDFTICHNSGKLVAFEEVGVFPGLEKTWTVAEESVKQDDLVYGFLLGSGTGGSEGADFTSAERMFYSPRGYSIKPMRNIYSKTNGSGECSFFVPSYVSYEGAYDKNGNSDVIKSLILLLKERQVIRNATKDSQRLVQKKAEKPITPEEAVLRKEGSIFPVLDIKEYLSTIYPLEDKFCASHYIGQLALNDDGSVKFCLNGNLLPVRHYPTKPDIDKTGALEIYEHPVFGNRDKYRYIAGCLPVGEKVLTKFGLKSVENINEEDCLINEDGNIVEINKIYIHDVKDEDIYKLKVVNTFRKTIFTKEHPILVSDAKFRYMNGSKAKRNKSSSKWNEFDFKYLKCEDVKVGQWTKVPNMYKVEKDVDFNNLWDKVNVRYDFEIKNPLNNDEFWWFVGLWFGDGWCENDNHSISVSFNAKEIMYMRRFEEFALKVLGRKVSKTVKNNCIECRICCSKLHRFMSSNFGRYAFDKTIPEWVKYLDRGKKIKLIHGYLDSDGCITKNKYGLYSTEFVSINYELLESFQDILFSIGIISSITRMRGSKNANILGSKVNQKECFHLRIAHSFSVKLYKYIGQDNDHKLLRIDFNNIPTTRRRPNIGCYFDQNEDYIYFKIESVEKSKYTGTVYNFECETHTFLCKNITTHNCDPIENDEVLWSVSLASVFVFDRFTRRIVAEYTGRPSTNDYFEMCYRLALYYGATIMYENNKKGLFGYFQLAKKALHLLADFPQHLSDKQDMKPRAFIGNTAKGYTSTPEVKRYGRRLQADWLLETAYMDIADLEYDDDGNPINKDLALNIHKIRSIGYLEECSQWNPDGNFDRVDAMTAVLIYDAELGQYEQKVVKERVKTLADDPFFRRTEKLKSNFGLLREVYHV